MALPEGKYIKFVDRGLSKSGKTRVWHVATKATPIEYLGEIRWFGSWRCYAFYAYNAYFEKQCLRDIANFCDEQTQQHKKSLQFINTEKENSP